MKPESSLPHSQEPVPVLIQGNQVHDSSSHFLKIHFNILLPPMCASSICASSIGSLRQNPYVPFLSPIRTTCPAHLITLDFITRIIFIEEYRSWSSLLRSLLQSSVNLSPLAQYYRTPSAYQTPTHHAINVLKQHRIKQRRYLPDEVQHSVLTTSAPCAKVAASIQQVNLRNSFTQSFQNLLKSLFLKAYL